MLNLGVHPNFLASCLRGVIAQRLMRSRPLCKIAFDLAEAPLIFNEVQHWLEPGQGQQLHGPGGWRIVVGPATPVAWAYSRC